MHYLGWYFGGFEGGAFVSTLPMFVVCGLVSGAFKRKPSELEKNEFGNE